MSAAENAQLNEALKKIPEKYATAFTQLNEEVKSVPGFKDLLQAFSEVEKYLSEPNITRIIDSQFKLSGQSDLTSVKNMQLSFLPFSKVEDFSSSVSAAGIYDPEFETIILNTDAYLSEFNNPKYGNEDPKTKKDRIKARMLRTLLHEITHRAAGNKISDHPISDTERVQTGSTGLYKQEAKYLINEQEEVVITARGDHSLLLNEVAVDASMMLLATKLFSKNPFFSKKIFDTEIFVSSIKSDLETKRRTYDSAQRLFFAVASKIQGSSLGHVGIDLDFKNIYMGLISSHFMRDDFSENEFSSSLDNIIGEGFTKKLRNIQTKEDINRLTNEYNLESFEQTGLTDYYSMLEELIAPEFNRT